MPYYDDGLPEHCAEQQLERDDRRRQDYSYASSCSLAVYDENGSNEGAGSSSSNPDTDSNGSWTSSDSASYAGASDFSSGSCSATESDCTGDGKDNKDDQSTARGGGSAKKWLKTLWSVLDRIDGQRDKEQQRNQVKSILRPPTTYKYVIGMSGFPSKVPVYPKRM